MALTIVLALAAPLLAACGYAALGWNRATAWLGAAAATVVLATATVLAASADGTRPTVLGPLRADALSAFMLLVIGAVSLLAMLASPGYLDEERAAGRAGPRDLRRYGILTQGFIAAMVLAVLASDLGVLWIAIEATTILTAFLVGFRRTRHATEAAWKYVVICSTGIAIAFLGIVLLNFAARHADVPASGALDWTTLTAHADRLDPGTTRIAVALLLIGFGTKAGLAPLHAWLPDAHSQAPAPVSALMSGVLLSVAFYALLRVKVIADLALGTVFTRTLLLAVALTSLALAAALLLGQRDYKRMLAYSSIEHMGLLALGTAVGSRLALAAVLLHILGHGLAKTVAFLASGSLHQMAGGSAISAVTGLTARAPLLAGAFGTGMLALLGLPPFSLFASEIAIFRAAFADGLGWAAGLGLALLLAVTAAIVVRTSAMLLGPPGPDSPAVRVPRPTTAALLTALAACAFVGVVAWPLRDLLDTAATLIGVPR